MSKVLTAEEEPVKLDITIPHTHGYDNVRVTMEGQSITVRFIEETPHTRTTTSYATEWRDGRLVWRNGRVTMDPAMFDRIVVEALHHAAAAGEVPNAE